MGDRWRGNQVHIFTSSWQHLTAFRGQDIGAGGFLEPFDIAFDSDGTAFLSDLWNNRVLRLEASGGPAPDSTGPQLELHAPEPRSTVDRPVVIAGSITDDRAVGSVQVAIRDRATGLWWDPIAQRWGSFVRSPAVLAAPGTSGSPFDLFVRGGSDWRLLLAVGEGQRCGRKRGTSRHRGRLLSTLEGSSAPWSLLVCPVLE